MTIQYRTETDSMGDVHVPKDALYQAQTQRAINNFPVSGIPMPTNFIQALAYIKQAAARSNLELKLLDHDIAHAIIDSCQKVIDKQFHEHFPIDIFQTGSGTSSNMNANEVIATLASEQLGQPVSPNDHVNMGQSSNDVIPTAIQVSAALSYHQQLAPALAHLSAELDKKKHPSRRDNKNRPNSFNGCHAHFSHTRAARLENTNRESQTRHRTCP